ncbi:MAG TPA: hypothetical protein VMJ10_16565 [Kofleriaceae bacterium]|nr:hypothetical protein [Kofleriaceae bacterium]
MTSTPCALLALALLAACGDNLHVPPDADTGCTATFAGNFTEQSTSPANCATIDATDPANVLLGFTVPSATLATSLTISIDLGTLPTTGELTSELVTMWSARALARVGNGACEYSAGATAVPTGNFTLALTAIDTSGAHGLLGLEQYVLTFPGSACGTGNTEQVGLTF